VLASQAWRTAAPWLIGNTLVPALLCPSGLNETSYEEARIAGFFATVGPTPFR
jgi:hypothetical protein